MSLFNSFQDYGKGSWTVESSQKLTASEKDQIKSAVVKDSQFGKSICFFMKSGGMKFGGLDPAANVGVGEEISLDKITLVSLKQNDKSITRVNIDE